MINIENEDSFKIITETFTKLIQQEFDIAVYLTDTEKCISYFPSKSIDAGVRPGVAIREDEPVYDIIHKGISVNDVVPKEVFGFAFKGIGGPIKDKDGNIIGSLALARNLEREMRISETSENLFSIMEELSASTMEIASMAENISLQMDDIEKLTEKTVQNIGRADTVISGIKAISSQSNLLAINAAIEAARVGEAGKGFAVVAAEMRKLSSLSNDSALQVSEMLNDMKDSIENIKRAIDEISDESRNQADTTSQISIAIEEVTKSSEILVGLSK